MRDAHQARQISVAARLHQHALARINEDDHQVGGAGSGHHVARVLLVAGCVADDEFALGRGEIAIRHVDGDALLALGLQAISEQRKIDRRHTALCAGFGNG